MNLNPGDFRLANPYNIFKTAISTTFSSPKRLLLAEKRALDHELRQLKLKSQEPGSAAHLMPKQLQFSSNEPQTWPAEGETAKAASNSSSTTTRKIDSPLDRRKQELVENVSFLEAQISSAEDHLAKLELFCALNVLIWT